MFGQAISPTDVPCIRPFYIILRSAAPGMGSWRSQRARFPEGRDREQAACTPIPGMLR